MTAIVIPKPGLAAASFRDSLKANGYRFFSGVPCSYFSSALIAIEQDPALTYVGASNEGAALALCAGAALSGRKPACLLQNSGLGNLVNPLVSLSLVYRIPTLLFISQRAYPDAIHDEPQHRIIGKTLPDLLDLLGIPHRQLPGSAKAFEQALAELDPVVAAGGVAAFLIRKDCFAGGAEEIITTSPWPLSRFDAIRIIGEYLPASAALVTTAGMISREVFAVADSAANFYMQGSMGHAMAIGLGIALAAGAARHTIVFDGDGGALMHMGSMATIGEMQPQRFLHLILDNEAYGTTGNQPTSSRTTRLDEVARACGYRRAECCSTPHQLRALLPELLAAEGPACIVVKVNRRNTGAPPRITTRYTPSETTARVTAALSSV